MGEYHTNEDGYKFEAVDRYDIAIIGGGPAGIAAAVEAILSGIEKVILFEKGDNHSMTIRQYYKDNKRVDKDWKGQKIELDGNVLFTDGTKESTIDLFDKLLDKHTINAQFNSEIEYIKQSAPLEVPFEIKTVKGDLFYATNVILAIGNMGKPNKPAYKIPPSIKKHVGHNLDHCAKNEDVLVVGGGDSAVEYAYYLADTNRVTLTYRRDSFTRANVQNMKILTEYVENNKIHLKIGIDIREIESKGGRILVHYTDGWQISYDKIVYAIGGVAPKDFLNKCGVETNEKGFPTLDKNYQTTTYGLYVAGDLAVRVGGSIAAGLN
ncbi:MAG: NAD(P)-binding domain-containing protein, partial [Campylobacterales bacterium]|nr:NAD(P)-binding domain-containing protein [Campylobacterales bacterium]